MKKLILLALLFSSALAFTVDIQPNFIRALPGESFEVKVIIVSDSAGFYSLRAEGSGIDFTRNYELLPGQSFQVPLSAKAPAESGESSITAIVSFGDETETATASVQVIQESEQSKLLNSTLHEIRWQLDELKTRAQGDQAASSKIDEAEVLLNAANSSYQTGYLVSAQSKIDEAQTKIEQAKTLIEISERSRWNMNIGLLAIGVLILLMGFVLQNYIK